MTTARADLVTVQNINDERGYFSSVESFGTGFTQAALAGNAILVPAAEAGSPDRVFLVSAFGGQIWVSKVNDATAEPRGILDYGKGLVITLKAGEALKVAPANLS